MSKVSSTAQTGILLQGPGALRLNAIQANLVCLTHDQQELVNKARKYAIEQSAKNILMKQVLTNQQQQQKSLQRHQALVLMCRVYVGSISFELREESIKAAFAPYGAIKSINMSWDSVTLKHKGFAFVEYEIPEAAQLALEHMNGIQLGGRQIKVGRPSNMPQAAPVIQKIQEECKENNRIYVSNVHPDLNEPELSNLFDPFGVVRSCKLAMTPNVENPQHRGYGFIEFETEAAATEALTMDNSDLGGEILLHVCRATTPAENLSIYGTLETEQASSTTNINSDEDIQLQLERANKEEQDRNDTSAGGGNDSATTGDLDTSKSDNNNSPPAKVIQQQTTTTNSTGTVNGKIEDDLSTSNVIVLRNMVASDDELDDDLKLDVYQECGRYGSVSQVVIYVDKTPKQIPSTGDDVNDHAQDDTNDRNEDVVKIFVKYKDETGSRKAREALNERFYGGRLVSAEYYDWNLFRRSDYSN